VSKLLRVNLTNGAISTEEIDASIAKDFIGGLGVGVKYLYDEIDPKVEPLSAYNKLIFATGPLTGTRAPAASRYMVVTKSPLTGAIANSNSAGFFGPELRFAGCDVLIFEGKSTIPVYLWINNEKVELRVAEKLWGKTTRETEDLIRTETDEKARVASIGPAGENLVRFACVINDKGRAAGRSGVGAVMGSKNLKAIAVRGTRRPSIFDKDGFKEAARGAREEYNAKFENVGFLKEWGTPGCIEIVSGFSGLVTRNYQTAGFGGWEKISGETYANTISKLGRRGIPCFGCPLACGRETEVTGPKEFAGDGLGPEYETIGAFGANCGVDDLRAIAKANYICNDMGMDTISCGNTIACAMELFEKGFLPEEEVGMKLNFGDTHAMVELVDKMAKREGFGRILGEGSYQLAQKYGHPELFMGVKKQEFPMYDARAVQGQGLHFATCNRGACHIRGEVGNIELYGINVQLYGFKSPEDVKPEIVEGKAKLCKEVQDHYSVIDASGMCNFICIVLSHEALARLLNTAMGTDYNVTGMLRAGERIFNLQRIFNLKAGLTAKDDTLPKRMLEEPLPAGPFKGHVAELGKMLPEYYQLRGWDERGVPTRGKLDELGLSM
jgi:aldehyde:ferredoxin oxidoreductase